MGLEPRELTMPTHDAVFPLASVGGRDGSGCYNPSTGEALWAARRGDRIEIYSTAGGYKHLVKKDDEAVLFLADITGLGGWVEPTSVALQRINGVLFCNLNGKRWQEPVRQAGHWIYRDTSVDRDGTGPWVLHGTARQIAWTGDTSAYPDHFTDAWIGGEILVLPSGRWVSNSAIMYDYTIGYTYHRNGVITSDNGGVTWTIRLEVTWYLGYYNEGWNRNFVKWGDWWYFGGYGNVQAAQAFKTQDFVNWVALGDIDGTGTFVADGPIYLFSSDEHIYKLRSQASGAREASMLWRTDGIPDASPRPVWEFVLNLDGPLVSNGRNFCGVMCNIGPDDDPMWVMSNGPSVFCIKGVSRVRQHPRDDGQRMSSAPRIYPPPKAQRIFGNIQ